MKRAYVQVSWSIVVEVVIGAAVAAVEDVIMS